MTTIGTILSGGECVGIGARAAGLTHLWGFEIEDKVAQVARDNGFNVITADVMGLDPTALEVPDVFHASPVCKRASNANQSVELNEDGTKEAPEDIAMGQKIASFIDVMTPKIVTIENVYAYRNFKAFKSICAALSRNGYMWDFDNLNAADYGVPQTRRRLILRAVRGALLPNLPQPEKWIGWYSAIEDLIPGLPDSQFAKWQLDRLPEEIRTFMINGGGNTNFSEAYPGHGCSGNHAPAHAVTTITTDGGNFPKAFIIDCQKAGDTETDRGVTLPQGNSPIFTITEGKGKRQPIRAFLISGQSSYLGKGVQVIDDLEPGIPVRAGENGGSYPKAWLVESKNNGQFGDGLRAINEPSTTVITDHKESHQPKAWLSQGRIVSMTPRALARFQSIPDSYILTDDKRLACKVIGNAVCPLLYQKIIGPLTGR